MAGANLPKLAGLELGGNNLADLTGLASANLPNLTSLNLGGNELRDLSPLSHLTNLTSLNLHGTSVDHIAKKLELSGKKLVAYIKKESLDKQLARRSWTWNSNQMPAKAFAKA